MTILGIDTSSAACSCALLKDDKLLGETLVNVGLTHSETIMPAVSALLEHEGLAPKDVDVFAVAAGPGSFTGVRIGVCAVKALAEACKKPCARVDALQAIAEGSAYEGLICPILDARRDQVYTALFRRKRTVLTRVREDAALSLDELIEALRDAPEVYFTGDGLNSYEARILEAMGDRALFAPAHIRVLRASALCRAAQADPACWMSADRLTPFYLRLPQAERERNARLAAKP
ncbi:MAG: tRNA (adenosine(37)-N6)-threonylcarbamoyltransferase complex dimerization subunit type 1 TsaB [Clostridia bacterium]|nr:tRNA (adenosine(37)-N6)-threonylcarbamoyltransferase complex dimerization subunit type 1 TsaB [Clostridia bacterium]